MWTVVFGGTVALLTPLIGYSGLVAVWIADPRKRADAYQVLKPVLTATAGAGGIGTVVMKLHAVGVL